MRSSSILKAWCSKTFQGEMPWTTKSRIPRRETPDASPGARAAKRAIRAARRTDSRLAADAVCRSLTSHFANRAEASSHTRRLASAFFMTSNSDCVAPLHDEFQLALKYITSRFNFLMTHGLLTWNDWNGFATNEKVLFVVLVPILIPRGGY